jgi:hypothetical protein
VTAGHEMGLRNAEARRLEQRRAPDFSSGLRDKSGRDNTTSTSRSTHPATYANRVTLARVTTCDFARMARVLAPLQ